MPNISAQLTTFSGFRYFLHFYSFMEKKTTYFNSSI